jgi:hypothetical protein
MSKFYFLLICLFSLGFLSAQEKLTKEEKARRDKNIQAGNPFAKFGSKVKIATLSKGKYLEFHDLDSIVIIGTIRWHVYKNKIVGDIIIDSINPDARPIGDAAGLWISPDPLSEEFPSWSPYSFSFNNPIRFVDPDGRAPESIIINNNTGQATYVNDGINKVFVTNQEGYNLVSAYKNYAESNQSEGHNKSISETYIGLIQKGGYELSMNSNIGLTARTVYAEMSGIGNTSDVDRQVVAESIVNRAESGKYGKTYSDILVKNQYNAVGTSAYNEPFTYVNNLREGKGTKSFFKANSDAITGNLANSFSSAFKAVKGIGPTISNGAEFYVSPPLKSTHFDGNKQLTNITTSILGLKGISGVWTRK